MQAQLVIPDDKHKDAAMLAQVKMVSRLAQLQLPTVTLPRNGGADTAAHLAVQHGTSSAIIEGSQAILRFLVTLSGWQPHQQQALLV